MATTSMGEAVKASCTSTVAVDAVWDLREAVMVSGMACAQNSGSR